MTIDLQSAISYDVESFPNVFTLRICGLFSPLEDFFEISDFRNDLPRLIQVFNWLQRTQTAMIGFNNIHYDYPLLHFIFCNPNCTAQQIYEKSQAILNTDHTNKFAHVIWDRQRFAPQIDLFKINHFDNKAKSTGLKALQINMRSPTVVDSPLKWGTVLTRKQIDDYLIPYNFHDVDETNQFAFYNLDALNYRISLIPEFGIDVMNWPDTKIGSNMMEKRLGVELCYEPNANGYGKGRKRQTPRTRIVVNEIIFPYVYFLQPEFNRVLDYFRAQVLTANQIEESLKGEGDEENKPVAEDSTDIKTKGIFKNLSARIDDFSFDFGVGGIHGSVTSQRVIATDDWLLRDIDVKGYYPDIAIKNRLAPEHLGQRFIEVYAEIPDERSRIQKERGKKDVVANTLKLAGNGVYGNSNNKYSVFYDPKYTMTVTINGQLMLCMLAERLMTVPTLKIIQINTDGITYFVHRSHEPHAAAMCKDWEQVTKLTLEDADYKRMFIRDVNNYIAEGMDGSLKLKGAYWTPDPLNYAASISNAQPPAWHKDLGNCVSTRAAVAAMVQGVEPETFIRLCTNPYDFMCRIKVGRADTLLYGGHEAQRNTRYYVSTNGAPMTKKSPPPAGKILGAFKKKNGVSDDEYNRVLTATGGQWDARVCTGKATDPRSWGRYTERTTNVQAGHLVTVCNDVRDFRFDNINYEYYVNEARKLIV